MSNEHSRWWVVVLLGAALFPAYAAGLQDSKKPQRDPTAETIRATTRLVIVDLVVTDREGNPVPDLLPSEVSVLEDGRRQQIATFSFVEQARAQAALHAREPLPPDVFSNQPVPANPSDTTAVVLLDLLNTPPLDRTIVRTAMLQYLKRHLAAGTRVAVYGLANRLVLLQGLTSDPRLLIAAVENYSAQAGRPKGDTGSAHVMEVVQQAGSAPMLDRVIETLREMEDAIETSVTTRRVATTLAAMRSIARSLAGTAGRKPLIWVTAGFPLHLENRAGYTSYDRQVRRTLEVLSDAHIAVYPVDVRGLIAIQPFEEIQQTSILHRNPRQRLDKIAEKSNELHQSLEAMRELAAITGGRAFVNRNDVDGAIAAGIAGNRIHYTLGYYPANQKWDGRFRRIQVQVSRPGVGVRHRRGYYALESPELIPEELHEALRRDPGISSAVVFQARVVNQDVTDEVKFEFAVPASSLKFKPQGSNGDVRAEIEVHALAFGTDGEVKVSSAQSAKVLLSADEFGRAQKAPLTFALPLSLRPGSYRVRLALLDRQSGRIGTLDIPVKQSRAH